MADKQCYITIDNKKKVNLPKTVIANSQSQFEIRQPITHDVFRVIRLDDRHSFILKTLSDTRALRKKRFDNEKRILQGLNSPFISKYIDHGEIEIENEKIPYIIIEEGFINLWIYKKGANFFTPPNDLNIDKIRNYVLQMCNSLEYLHIQKYVHRDIKPANFVFKGGHLENIMMIDLGLAKYEGAEDTLVRLFSDVTQNEESVGPKHVFSPELIKYAFDKNTPVDHRSDYWQLARVIWFLTTGNISSGRPSKKDDPSGGKIASIVDDLIHDDPEDRIQTINLIKTRINEL